MVHPNVGRCLGSDFQHADDALGTHIGLVQQMHSRLFHACRIMHKAIQCSISGLVYAALTSLDVTNCLKRYEQNDDPLVHHPSAQVNPTVSEHGLRSPTVVVHVREAKPWHEPPAGDTPALRKKVPRFPAPACSASCFRL